MPGYGFGSRPLTRWQGLAVGVVAPVNNMAPVASGGTTSGSVLSVTAGTWNNAPSGYAYQWRRDGVDIAGATVASYTVVAADTGHALTCRVLASNAGGSTAATSNALAIAAVAQAPGFLAGIALPAYGAWAVQRLVPGYAGALYRLRRASDAATLDVSPQAGGDYPDMTAIVAWAGGSALTVPMIYDQTGNGRHLTQTTVANQPGFDPTQTFGNAVPIQWDGVRATNVQRSMSVGGMTLDRSAMSSFRVMSGHTSINSAAIIFGSDEARSAGNLAQSLNLTPLQVYYSNGSSAVSAPTGAASPRIQKTVFGLVTTTANVRQYLNNGVYTTNVTQASAAMPRVTFGTYSGSGGEQQMFFGTVLYDTSLSTTDATSVVTSLNTAFAVPLAFDYTLVFDGDSIMEGFGATLNRNIPAQLARLLTKSAEQFSTAIYGQRMASIYANRTSRFPPCYSSARTSIVFVEAGINDINGNGGAATTGSDLYSASTGPLITYLKGLGYKVIVGTLLPTMATTGAKETERLNYNALVTANAAGADYVLDLASNPTMGTGTAASNTTLYVDGTHLTTLGDSYVVGAPSGTYAGQYTYYYALQQVLRTVTGNAGYVP